MRTLRGYVVRGSRRLLVGAVIVTAAATAMAPGAQAADWNKRWSVGFRVGEYLHVDKQKGGFRFFSPTTRGSSESTVSIGNVPIGTLSVARGVKKWERTQLSLELEVSRINSSVGDETVYLDGDGSTRVEDPLSGQTSQSGDERFESRGLGDITMTPIFCNALFHWSGRSNPDRADFYAGGGLGVVLAELSESDEYRDFAGDRDGTDDVQVDNAMGLMIKAGANIRLSRSHDWFLYFEGQFMATGVLTSQSQVTWRGVDYLAGTRSVDLDNNGTPDVTIPADYRLMDPGHIRMDGGMGGVGIRYRFGGGKSRKSDGGEPASVGEGTTPEPTTPEPSSPTPP